MYKMYNELEREAYIQGNIELAEVYADAELAQTYDQEMQESENDLLNQIADLSFEITQLEDEVLHWKEKSKLAEQKLEQFKKIFKN